MVVQYIAVVRFSSVIRPRESLRTPTLSGSEEIHSVVLGHYFI